MNRTRPIAPVLAIASRDPGTPSSLGFGLGAEGGVLWLHW